MEKLNERTLYENYINSQYEYFKCIEPLRITEINNNIKGKVLSPSAERTQKYYKELMDKSDININININKNTNMMNYKELALFFHPDKNADRIDEANEYFIHLKNLIDEDKVDILNELLKTDDANKWNKIKELCNPDSIYFKEIYCKGVQLSNWYNWSKQNYEEYITPEEYIKILTEECDKLQKEHDQLQKENDTLRRNIKL